MPPQGWYRDPHGAPGVNRWWTGTQWSEQTQIAPPPPPIPDLPSRPPLAGYGTRLGAWLLDFVIVTVISLPLLDPFGGYYHETRTATTHSVSLSLHGPALLAHAVLVLLYGMLFIGSRRGQTPGMMLLGVRCVDTNVTTGSIGYGRALLRAFVEYILFAALFLPWVLDMLFPLWDPQNQTIHDKAGGSIVLAKAPSSRYGA